MLSPQLRSKVHNLWTLFWSAGMTNPLVAVEQITYLLFLRQLERLDAERVKAGKPSIYYQSTLPHRSKTDYNQCRWSYIRQQVSFPLLNDIVFPWLRGLEEWLKQNSTNGRDRLRQVTGRLNDAYFVLDPNKTTTLTTAIQTIDELFRQLDARSANADIMGDVFEHLLSEITSSGKNGQFRTPRHVIRFMVELLDPPWEIAEGNQKRPVRILDPACGTCGFLVNTLLHWRKKTTAADVLRLEWDGTPHRTFGDGTVEKLPLDAMFTGFDNDRSMVRIGWMNLILHGLEFPRVEQRDSLSKRLDADEAGAPKRLSDTYDYVLANPPFTGSVDEADLSGVVSRFPRVKGKPITTKSELLFVWLMLDLLRVGGRAAVVVPDGVLFGSTNAHRELRRQLLFENTLEAVVSLPAGVFLPYAGVKTSILVFQKAAEKVTPGADPRTREVWFYEVQDEAFSLDQKRKERYQGPSDLWDALAKLKARDVSPRYFQPEFWKERWRALDADFLKIFPEQASQRDQLLAIHEIFPTLNHDPDEAAEEVIAQAVPRMQPMFDGCILGAHQAAGTTSGPQAKAEFERLAKKLRGRLVRAAREWLDKEYGTYGQSALEAAFDRAHVQAAERLEHLARQGFVSVEPLDAAAEQRLFERLAKGFAALDGYEVWLRSLDSKEQPAKNDLKPVLSWVVPVRAWARLDSWGIDPKTKGEVKKPTHEAGGEVRGDYLIWLRETLQVFDTDGTVKEEFRDRLDPVCIEATDFNLSASRHKPFTFEAGRHRPPADVIRELDSIHGEIRGKLGKLLAMVEEKE